jgi:hypothetical protein
VSFRKQWIELNSLFLWAGIVRPWEGSAQEPIGRDSAELRKLAEDVQSSYGMILGRAGRCLTQALEEGLREREESLQSIATTVLRVFGMVFFFCFFFSLARHSESRSNLSFPLRRKSYWHAGADW